MGVGVCVWGGGGVDLEADIDHEKVAGGEVLCRFDQQERVILNVVGGCR